MRRLESRQINELSGLAGFIRRWDAEKLNARPARDVSVDRSCFGNINIGGQPKTATSHLVSKNDQDFYAFIEPGVRDWVAFFVERMGVTTYTSCEGHDYGTRGQEPDERHVGIIPRSRQERDDIIDFYHSISTLTAHPYCEVSYMDHHAVQGKHRISAVDIYISKQQNADWDQYFSSLNSYYQRVVNLSHENWESARRAENHHAGP
jgi:hypothetical protein